MSDPTKRLALRVHDVPLPRSPPLSSDGLPISSEKELDINLTDHRNVTDRMSFPRIFVLADPI